MGDSGQDFHSHVFFVLEHRDLLEIKAAITSDILRGENSSVFRGIASFEALELQTQDLLGTEGPPGAPPVSGHCGR